MSSPVLRTHINGIPEPQRGKVRDIYDFGDKLLIVATDRISAYDVVMPNGIPQKGIVLTQISRFWFEQMADVVPNHVVSVDVADFPAECQPYAAELTGRSMLVKKTKPLPVECIMRGYIAGSGWKDYQKTGAVCGVELPAGLVQFDRLEKPIFTPSTKAESGHDLNISVAEMENLIGRSLTEKVIDASMNVYTTARAYAEEKGIIIADTKFEFGILDG
ncbi:phosphoribosylaminoimidazolesuccinocarboxamide synthase, partial [bacterium]|nr:phosphoribosylaminoimidazolesuccinocarboxamide synthase [bacterium]